MDREEVPLAVCLTVLWLHDTHDGGHRTPQAKCQLLARNFPELGLDFEYINALWYDNFVISLRLLRLQNSVLLNIGGG